MLVKIKGKRNEYLQGSADRRIFIHIQVVRSRNEPFVNTLNIKKKYFGIKVPKFIDK